MHRLTTLAIIALALLAPACTLGLATSDGNAVSERDGILYLDDVALQHKRQFTLQGTLEPGTKLKLTSAVGVIDVVGMPGSGYDLVIDLHAEHHGDGKVQFSGGQLEASSQMDGKILINAIRGTLPEGVALQVASGTGEIVLADFSGQTDFRVSSGTGDVRLTGCDVASIDVDTGTGEIVLSAVTANMARVDTGTGVLSCEGSTIAELRAKSGTGDIRVRSSRIMTGRFDSGTGDVILTDSTVNDLHSALGTGDVIEKRGGGAPQG